MRTVASLICFFILISCQNETKEGLGDDYISKAAIYRNDLPADGCDWHFYIFENNEGLQLIEDEESRSKTTILKAEAANTGALPNLKVMLTYKLTGKSQKVQCGWNKIVDFQEIHIDNVEIQ